MAETKDIGERAGRVHDALAKKPKKRRSWWCDQCCVEVYDLHCQHCGKTKREKA